MRHVMRHLVRVETGVELVCTHEEEAVVVTDFFGVAADQAQELYLSQASFRPHGAVGQGLLVGAGVGAGARGVTYQDELDGVRVQLEGREHSKVLAVYEGRRKRSCS